MTEALVEPSEPMLLGQTRLSPAGGAEIHGLDLSQPIDDALKDAILAAFRDHHILVFRDQSLSDTHQHAFSKNFGPLEEHVHRMRDGSKLPLVHIVNNLDAHGSPTTTPHTHGNYYWHTDKSYHEVPSLATLLHAVILPPSGGDTQFANTRMAYDALPKDLKREIADLRVVHSWEVSRRNTGNKPATPEEIHDRPPVTHPLVRTHPDSGDETLFIGCHTSHIENMPVEGGRALLQELLEHTEQPQFIYTHQWRPGDLVMWDNRCLLHRAVANFDMAAHPRILHRTVVRGSKPY
jgi:alpha-ketoglutarate-dependent taurine dioxygenase